MLLPTQADCPSNTGRRTRCPLVILGWVSLYQYTLSRTVPLHTWEKHPISKKPVRDVSTRSHSKPPCHFCLLHTGELLSSVLGLQGTHPAVISHYGRSKLFNCKTVSGSTMAKLMQKVVCLGKPYWFLPSVVPSFFDLHLCHINCQHLWRGNLFRNKPWCIQTVWSNTTY